VFLRITNNMLSNNLLRNLEAAQGRMDQLQNRMSSGKRISKPSDNPSGIENAMRIKGNITAVEQWKLNASEGLAYMNNVDSTMQDISSMLQRARELAIQGANGSLTTEDKTKVSNEVEQILEQIKQLANTKMGSKYLFGGTANVKPYDSSNTWVGTDDVIKFQVGSEANIPITVNGKALFGVSGGSVGMFSILQDLYTALQDPAGSADIRTAISNLDNQIETVLDKRAELGARVNRMNAIYEQLESTSLNLTENLSTIMDADLAETVMEFKNQENVYRAALSVGAQIIQPSLVDFMK
jgi:flagellar hook-associated protein 3 FlgL